MIVATSTFDAFKYAAIGGFVLSIATALVFLPKNVDRKSEHAAKIRKRVLRVLGLLVLLTLVGFAVEPFGAPLVVVRITPAGDVTKLHERIFGSTSYAFQDGHSLALANDGKTVVVNDTNRQMHVKLQSYGDSTLADLSHLALVAESVAPMTSVSFDHPIDFVGPDEPPPHEVEGVVAENRYWLTW